jgi:hypothetical protein
MKDYGSTRQYACFKCRKSFKRKQFSAAFSHYMTSEQLEGQKKEEEDITRKRQYKCPDCGGVTHYMGIDFKAPKRNDVKSWEKVREFVLVTV